jgi:hypothetical protein
MTQYKRCIKALLTAVALTSLSGCTVEDAAATAVELSGDLARQLATFWVL